MGEQWILDQAIRWLVFHLQIVWRVIYGVIVRFNSFWKVGHVDLCFVNCVSWVLCVLWQVCNVLAGRGGSQSSRRLVWKKRDGAPLSFTQGHWIAVTPCLGKDTCTNLDIHRLFWLLLHPSAMPCDALEAQSGTAPLCYWAETQLRFEVQTSLFLFQASSHAVRGWTFPDGS